MRAPVSDAETGTETDNGFGWGWIWCRSPTGGHDGKVLQPSEDGASAQIEPDDLPRVSFHPDKPTFAVNIVLDHGLASENGRAREDSVVRHRGDHILVSADATKPDTYPTSKVERRIGFEQRSIPVKRNCQVLGVRFMSTMPWSQTHKIGRARWPTPDNQLLAEPIVLGDLLVLTIEYAVQDRATLLSRLALGVIEVPWNRLCIASAVGTGGDMGDVARLLIRERQ